MNKVGICGNYGNSSGKENGQTVKTRMLTLELEKQYGANEVGSLDVSLYHNKLLIGLKAFLLTLRFKNIIILPAQKALASELRVFSVLCKIFRKRLHYYVVGGWLVDSVRSNSSILKLLSRCHGIYVELEDMKIQLSALGLHNIYKVNKFKSTNDSIRYYTPQNSEPYRLVYFSRVSKEKGIEDAVHAVEKVNDKLCKIFYTLDIYGKIDEPYSQQFQKLQTGFPEYIKYCGCVDFEKSSSVLCSYYAMLFPTYYEGEGYPNAVVDAFLAGIPIIATNWKYNSMVLNNRKDSIIYERINEDSLYIVLSELIKCPETLINMRSAAIERGKYYSPQCALDELINNLS